MTGVLTVVSPLQSWQYLAGVTATLSEQGEAAISGVPTYMQVRVWIESDLHDYVCFN